MEKSLDRAYMPELSTWTKNRKERMFFKCWGDIVWLL